MDSGVKRKILIIEDEEKIASLMASYLKASGYDVRTAPTGAAGLACASEHAIDLVILDLRLPDLGGYQVAEELRRHYHAWAMPILMVTAMDQPIDRLRGFAHGADGYLTKPFHLPELGETIDMLLGGTTGA
jgi:DNA-binding response OmpR family regulator